MRIRYKLMAKGLLRPIRVLELLSSIRSKEGLRRTTTLPSGQKMTLLLPDELSVLLYFNIEYEPDVAAFMDKVLKPGMTVFDVGAHIGYHSLMARQRVSEDGKVISFEPLLLSHELLKLNCQPYENMTVEAIAINDGSEPELMLYYFGVRYSGYTTSTKPRTNKRIDDLPTPEQKRVSATSIDNYVASKGTVPDFIKLDVEGGEMDALRGAKKVISECKPFIIFEGGDLGRTPENNTRACLAYLVKLGYSFYEFDHKKSLIVPHTSKQVYDGCWNILCVP